MSTQQQVRASSGLVDSALTARQKVRARRHIAEMAARHRRAQGSIEHVSLPRVRRPLRRLDSLRVRVMDLFGRVWRRLADSHRFPGRVVSRLRLYRPTKTLSKWVLVWSVMVGGFFYLAFTEVGGERIEWIMKWALGGSLAALVATLWQDFVKNPFRAGRIRRRIVADPARLLKLSLAEQTMKVIELDPPLDTVPRKELYDELLPGVLARTKDIQILAGDPGAGKTTALLDLATILAKIGLVPVVLQLRGERADGDDLFELAKKRFEKQVRPLVRSGAEGDSVWRWLCRRQRVAILIDDIDQIGFDGEPGFLMRRLLEDLAPEGQPVIVTARPAGVPAGIAASAIEIEPLEFDTAVEIVARPKQREPGATTKRKPSRRQIETWVRAGELRVAPLYLEALAELTSVGFCPDLPEDPGDWSESERPGRSRRVSEWRRNWNPLWVRYLLLDRFYGGIADGHVRRSQAIDAADRCRCLHALEGAALGALGAVGLEAKAAARAGVDPKGSKRDRPLRRDLVDFVSSNDRRPPGKGERDGYERGVSQHEAIDAGERLRILDRDQHEEPQFRHRIMQAFFAGRCLARLGRDEQEARAHTELPPDEAPELERWVGDLMDHHHPEKLTAHLALTFAAIHADDRSLKAPEGKWGVVAERIADLLVVAVRESFEKESEAELDCGGNGRADFAKLDPRRKEDPCDRWDPDDGLTKLTTAANIATLLTGRERRGPGAELSKQIIELLPALEGAIRWTKQQALPAIAALDTEEAWQAIWRHFARDDDYQVRRSAGRQLERFACSAFCKLSDSIEAAILTAGYRASKGDMLGEATDARELTDVREFVALGWVLPAVVSGLSEELANEPGEGEEAGAAGDGLLGGSPARSFRQARARLEELAALAFGGGQANLEDALAQGFKADAMRHASEPSREFKGPGWVASNRRLVADVALPHAESWYARMLLYQALVLYGVAGNGREDAMDVLAYRMHRSRERHPLVRQATKLARSALRRADLKSERWKAYVWSDAIENAGSLPAALSHRATQLVGDVTVFVDLKEGSPLDRQGKFAYMEELPYCLSGSPDRHEILGAGCPSRCGWGFCPYRAVAPDEPNELRGVSRGFCRAQKRAALHMRSPAWQGRMPRRKMYEFWRQMEFKARR
jgi:NACHT domain